jgi:hypothetical protein
MRQLGIAAAVLVAAVAVLVSTAAAVEVTVKSDTKLYDNTAKVLAEVQAGQTFKAEQLSGGWVYGFLPTKSGGVRGWIPIAALDLNDKAKRDLAQASEPVQTKPAEPENAARQDEPILLRYKIGEGELQVYQTSTTLDTTFSTKPDPGARAVSFPVMKAEVRVGNYLRGKGRDQDGTILAEAGLYRLEMDLGMKDALGWVDTKLDHQGMRTYRDGRLVSSTRYGEGQLADAPGVAPFLNKPFPCRLNERHELLEMEVTAEGEKLLAVFARGLGGNGLKELLMGNFAYPEAPVRPGFSWEEDVSQNALNRGGPAAPSRLAGRAKYTVLGRTTYRNRSCVRIRMDATLSGAVESSPARATSQGDYYIDEATGMPLSGTVKATITVAVKTEEGNFTVTTVSTTETSYIGNKLND